MFYSQKGICATGYTTTLLKKDVFGVDYREEIIGYGIVAWSSTVDEHANYSKSHQPAGWDPNDPPSRIANDLHYHIVSALDVDSAEVYFYLGIGGKIKSTNEKIDFFVEYRGNRATVAIFNQKDLNSSSDFIFTPEDVKNDESLEMFAGEIADFLKGGGG